jgi:small-conductance mechanosensitive channel
MLLLVLTLPAAAKAQTLEELRQREQRWSLTLDTLREQIDQGEISERKSENLRARLERIIQESQAIDSLLEERLAPLRAQLDALGSPPADGELDEDARTAQTRERLNEQIRQYMGLTQRADAVTARAQSQLRDLSVLTGRQRAERFLERGPGPLLPSTWKTALSQSAKIWPTLKTLFADWWATVRPAQRGWMPYFLVLVVVLVSIGVSRFTRLWLERNYGQRDDIKNPGYPRAVLAFGVTGLGRGISPSLIAYMVWLTLRETELVTSQVEPISLGLLSVIVVYALIGQLSRAALAPSRPQWSIVPLDADQTVKAGLSMHSLAIVLAILAGLEEAGQAIREPLPEFQSVMNLIAMGLLVVFLAPFLGKWLWQPPQRLDRLESPDAEQAAQQRLPKGLALLRFILILAAAVTLAASALGYDNLSTAMMDGLLGTALIIGFGLMLHTVVLEALNSLLSAERRGVFARTLDLSQGGSESLLFWLTLLLDTCLILIVAPLILLSWGVPDTVLVYWFNQIASGIKIGDSTFEPLLILYGLAVFVGALIAVRFLRRILNDRILARTRLDVGARHSVSAATGYVGFAVAAMLAVTTMGLDLSNLAIVAGALSVGIGFGLQNVVNNFVSGLLILIERPIKVGDWIVVSGYEGTVKRISVRSTEIETFDRAEVIVPNSELVSAPVTNWTHKTRVCRVIIPVGVAYGSDTELVRNILMKAAKEHENVLSFPAPMVIFKSFGHSSLDFELRVYARDTDYYLTLINDMHFAIDKAFRDKGVEIPFPQRDLHLHDSETLAALLRKNKRRKIEKQSDAPDKK